MFKLWKWVGEGSSWERVIWDEMEVLVLCGYQGTAPSLRRAVKYGNRMRWDEMR